MGLKSTGSVRRIYFITSSGDRRYFLDSSKTLINLTCVPCSSSGAGVSAISTFSVKTKVNFLVFLFISFRIFFAFILTKYFLSSPSRFVDIEIVSQTATPDHIPIPLKPKCLVGSFVENPIFMAESSIISLFIPPPSPQMEISFPPIWTLIVVAGGSASTSFWTYSRTVCSGLTYKPLVMDSSRCGPMLSSVN